MNMCPWTQKLESSRYSPCQVGGKVEYPRMYVSTVREAHEQAGKKKNGIGRRMEKVIRLWFMAMIRRFGFIYTYASYEACLCIRITQNRRQTPYQVRNDGKYLRAFQFFFRLKQNEPMHMYKSGPENLTSAEGQTC